MGGERASDTLEHTHTGKERGKMADTRSDKAEIDRRKGTRGTKQAPKSLSNKGQAEWRANCATQSKETSLREWEDDDSLDLLLLLSFFPTPFSSPYVCEDGRLST